MPEYDVEVLVHLNELYRVGAHDEDAALLRAAALARRDHPTSVLVDPQGAVLRAPGDSVSDVLLAALNLMRRTNETLDRVIDHGRQLRAELEAEGILSPKPAAHQHTFGPWMRTSHGATSAHYLRRCLQADCDESEDLETRRRYASELKVGDRVRRVVPRGEDPPFLDPPRVVRSRLTSTPDRLRVTWEDDAVSIHGIADTTFDVEVTT